MVSQINLNPIVNQTLPGINTQAGVNFAGNSGTSSPNSIFPSGNNYTDDIMMGSIDFDKILDSENQQILISQDKQVSSGENQQTENDIQEEKDTDENKKNNSSNIAKILCAIGGFLAPIGEKLIKWAKGENPKELFKYKPLAITCAVLGVAGLGIGMLLDACIDAKKASDLEKVQKA